MGGRAGWAEGVAGARAGSMRRRETAMSPGRGLPWRAPGFMFKRGPGAEMKTTHS